MEKLGGKILRCVCVILFCLMLANAAGAGETGSLKFVSQKIAKAYFYLNLGIRVDNARKDLKQGLADLDTGLKKLEKISMDDESKNVVQFIAFTREQMASVIKEPYSEENGAMMLDFSESLLEGAELINEKLASPKEGSNGMLAVVEQMKFLLERINKYYIAHKAGFKDYNNVVQLQKAVKEFEADLVKVNEYHYPTDLQSTTGKLNKFWPIAKRFYLDIEKGTLPVIVMASTDNLNKLLDKLISYHSKAAHK